MSRYYSFLIASLSGVTLGFASIYPDNFITPVVVFLAICVLIYAHSIIRAGYLFWVGFFFHIVSMWWLTGTLEKFGGMPYLMAFLLMLLHSCASSVQFYLVFLFSKKRNTYLPFYASFPLLWVLGELYFPKLFPWSIAHFFIHAPWIASYAKMVGTYGVSLIILALAVATVACLKASRPVRYSFFFFVCIFTAFGFSLSRFIDNPDQLSTVVVIQGNLGLDEKGFEAHYQDNIRTYVELTKRALETSEASNVEFIVWPESVVSKWHDLDKGLYDQRAPDPYEEGSVPLLYGALGFERSAAGPRMYNAAVLRDENGQIAAYSAKKILMPFGEYVPFADIFPWIRNLTPIQNDFSVGRIDDPLRLITKSKKEVKLGVNICYEDLSPELSRDHTSRGAELLVNLTNDAWYGDSAAPYQHNLLARFRAIETDRYFLRSTNTGLTTLINPSGQIVQSLPIFKEDFIVMKPYLRRTKTTFVQYGNVILFAMMSIYLLVAVFEKRKRA